MSWGEPSEPDDAHEVQQQQAEAALLLLDARASLAQIPVKIRLMVVAFTLYYWNVPLSRIALWMGVSPGTVLNWAAGLPVAMALLTTRTTLGLFLVSPDAEAEDETRRPDLRPTHRTAAFTPFSH